MAIRPLLGGGRGEVRRHGGEQFIRGEGEELGLPRRHEHQPHEGVHVALLRLVDGHGDAVQQGQGRAQGRIEVGELLDERLHAVDGAGPLRLVGRGGRGYGVAGGVVGHRAMLPARSRGRIPWAGHLPRRK